MKAIKVVGAHDVRYADVETPRVQSPTDVLVKVKAGGICGSDIHVAHGTNIFATYPRIVGHEIAGVVEEVGTQVGKLCVGDRVVLEPFKFCGTCYACTHGRRNVCQSLQVYGAHIDGGFSDYMVVDEQNLHKIPDVLTFEQATLIEPYTIGAQATWHADVQSGDMVLIHGAGPTGLILADTAKSMGAVVIVSEVSENRLRTAKAFGADHLINPAKQDFKQVLNEITGGMGPNVIFEAAGIPALLTESVELASVAGRIVPLAFSNTPIPINFGLVTKKELRIFGTRHQTYKFVPVIEGFESRLDRVNAMITGVYPAEQFGQAFEAFTEKDSDNCKIVLTF